jgi:hypothetical protein
LAPAAGEKAINPIRRRRTGKEDQRDPIGIIRLPFET